jgi:hypothetical protein
MAERKYEKYVMTELKLPPDRMPPAAYFQRATKVLWMDGGNTPGAFNVNVVWLWKATDFNHDEAHKHDYDEIIGFFGSDPARPRELNAEVEFWLEDEKYILTKSTLLFIPKGLTHCPLRVLKVDKPIFHFTTVRSGSYRQNLIGENNGSPTIKGNKTAKRKNEKYVVTELKTPEEVTRHAAEYATRAIRLLWLDEDVVPGAFHINTAWYTKATPKEGTSSHVHDYDEVIGFFGGDPDNPSDLGGEVEIWIEDEKYNLTKSALIFAPKGVRHCPLRVVRVDRPVFHFTIVPDGHYIQKDVREGK